MLSNPTGPLAQLRAATKQIHARIDGSPCADAIVSGTLPISRYGSYLRALQALHVGMAPALSSGSARDQSQLPALSRAASRHTERQQRLERDLAYLQVDPLHVDAAGLHALVLAQGVRLDALEMDSPARLFGHLYVLEGSQLGGLVLAQALGRRPELSEGGVSYFTGAGRETKTQFHTFIADLEAALTDAPAVAAAVESACSAFEGVEAVLNAVISDRLDGPALAESLNVDAGTHPVPHDLREIQAALQAGELSYQRFRYYQARYGERGRSFTRSDSAWLATLARREPALLLQQVTWLARLLAARGMPRLLLERHLDVLHDTLVRSVPERAADYRPLQQAARALEAERTALLSDTQLEQLAREFNPKGPASDAHPIAAAEAGTLIVAAVIDEKHGIPHAVESMAHWLSDPTRFNKAWTQALEHTLEQARRA